MHKHLATLLAGSPWLADSELAFCPARQKSPESKAAKRRFVASLRVKQFDLAISMPNSFSSAWLCYQIGARRRVGYSRDGRGILLTDRVVVPNKRAKAERKQDPKIMPPGPYWPLPLVDYYGNLAKALGCDHPGDQLSLFTTPADDQSVQERLTAEGISKDGPLVVVCPGANFGASKCWPAPRFAAVADTLTAKHGASIVISPGPGEEPLAEAISHAMTQPNILLIEPCTSLGELKSLIKSADLLLGNDTGPRHFARAFDIHRVTVFGPTDARWTQTSHGRETIVRVEVPCGPCHEKICPLEQQVCMQDVTVEMVVAACEHELATAATIARG